MNNTKDHKLKPIIGFELCHGYTFDTFVTGLSNQSAYNAALAVAKHPGKRYNPYFICGEVGMGKTHLMQAIGHYIINNRKTSNVFFVSSERFTNDILDAVKNSSYSDVINKYLSANVLLIEGIYFPSNRPKTRTEFIGVIKRLKDAGKQIIIDCVEHPGKIFNKMEMNLIGAKAGSIKWIDPPGMKTRITILTKKAKEMGFDVPQEVIRSIAKLSSCVRALESMLTRLDAIKQIDPARYKAILRSSDFEFH